MTKPKATQLDIIIGRLVKKERIKLGYSQKDLGDAIGVTFQQVQKYERGINRVSLERAIKICNALHCELLDIIPRGELWHD